MKNGKNQYSHILTINISSKEKNLPVDTKIDIRIILAGKNFLKFLNLHY